MGARSGKLRRIGVLLAATVLALAVSCGSAWARIDGASPAISERAPKVSAQPHSARVEEGEEATFEARAVGSPTPTVQWEVSTDGGHSWSAVAGGTEDLLVIASAKTSENGDELRATFTNSAGSDASKPATLTVLRKPVVTKQPLSVTVEEGQNAVFEAVASGFPTPTVQWEVSSDGGSTWRLVAGGTSDRLTVADTVIADSGDEYRAVFENEAAERLNSVKSEVATLTVHKLPVVTKQPLSVTVEEGQSAVLEAAASGFPAPTVQWEISTDGGGTWSPVEGATSDQLTIADVGVSESGYEYRAVFTNVAGKATSSPATVTIVTPPAVTEQPAAITVEVGRSAAFDAAASGFPAPTVQWEVSSNGGASWSAVAGATADQLTIASTQVSENGDEYRAVFTNVAGKATSDAATLTVATHHYRVVAWGQNSFGQLGDASFEQSDVPVPASGPNFVTAVAAGKRHSLALLSNGTVMAWGSGGSGQLGDGEYGSSDVAVLVEGLSHVTAIAAGSDHSLALLSNGTVVSWGGNEHGQLGDGGTAESDVPVAVKGLADVTAIAAGTEYSLALLSDGKVMAWGANEHGQLGDGDTKDSDVPVAVKALTGATAIAAGGEHALALLSGGTVMAWGDDEYGQLGNSSVGSRGEEGEEERFSTAPVAVDGVSGVGAIAAGARHSLALLAGGTVVAWGEDQFGELGDDSIVRSEETPVAVSGLSGVTAISAGGEHSMALLGNGTVMTWGENKFGELGDGVAGEASDVPVLVSSLGQVAGIAAGGGHDLAYSEPIPTVSAVSPTSGSTEGGTPVTITGANFEGATAVRFGANGATSFTVTSATSISATAPAGSAGTVNVTVTTHAGTSPTVVADRFTYVLPPSIKKLSAKRGPGAGGTTVTITGTRFEGVTAVSFGASAAREFTVNSATSITAVSPEGAGTVDVTVTTIGGTSAIVKGDEFGFVPTVEGVAPSSGAPAGGTEVTITGAGFATGKAATAFKFGSKPATEVECATDTSCTAVAPANKAGTVEVTAAVGKLKSSDNPPGDRFTYE
jgi:alpha-tubulin suppressor-like RCC1 family protein